MTDSNTGNIARKRRRIIGISGMIVVCLAQVGILWKMSQPLPAGAKGVDGEITKIDYNSRVATIKVTRKGKVLELRGEIADDCRITVNGASAEAAALEVGDQVHAKGLLYWFPTLKAVAQDLQVTRDTPDSDASTQEGGERDG